MSQNYEPPKVVFENEEFLHSARSFQKSTPKMVQWVIKYSGGLIRDENKANHFLIGVIIFAVVVSGFFIFGVNRQELPPKRLMSEFPI